MHAEKTKNIAISLRKQGKTYSEIISLLGGNIPKSTLSFWLSAIPLKESGKKSIRQKKAADLSAAQKAAAEIGRLNFVNKLEQLKKSKRSAVKLLANRDVGKLLLAALFLRTNSARSKNGLYFASADKNLIKLILHLLRFCYNIDEDKFRATVQCRKDADHGELEKFWSQLTKIPLSQMYKTQVDPRPKGKITGNAKYLGVCRINYLSNELYWEIQSYSSIFM